MNNKIKNILDLRFEYKKPSLSKEKYKTYIKENNTYNFKDNNKLLLSFLIVAYNENDLIFRLLDSIICTKSKEYEIVIVDNGLSEITKEKLKSYSLRHIITSVNVGCSTGRNIGSLYCKSPIIFFIDADGYLEDVDKSIEISKELNDDGKLIAIRGNIKEINKKRFMKPKNYDLGNKKINSYLDAEGVTLFKRKDFIKVGGFEDGLVGHEGIVLCFRMIEVYNYSIEAFIYQPELILYHDYSLDFKHLLNKRTIYSFTLNKVYLEYPLITFFLKHFNGERRLANKNYNNKALLNKIIDYFLKDKINDEFISTLKEYNRNNSYNLQQKFNFSVVITCYNLGSYIQKAIDSITNQTLENIEIIIVDDCSDDPETIFILNNLSKKFNLIRLSQNSGPSAARNEGIIQSKSEYICCLDADDFIEPTYLEKARNILDNYPDVGIVSCFLKAFGAEKWIFRPKNDVDIIDALVDNPVHCASCFRKEISIKVGMYDTEMRSHEDWDHWLKIMKDGWKIKVIPEYLMNYLVRKNSNFDITYNESDKYYLHLINNNKDLFDTSYNEVLALKHLRFLLSKRRFKNLKNTKAVRYAEFIVKKIISKVVKI
ncbi:MAG: glycosyltransferase [Candidatus Dadabacteria bacterium]|nr:glycosyltransferase [Candidatus Dadabacteria bacterium]